MSITKLGDYELPLSDEERNTLIGSLGDIMTQDLLHSAADLLAVKVPSSISLSFLYLNHEQLDEIRTEIENRFKLISAGIQNNHKPIIGLDDPEHWEFEVKLNEDNIPHIHLNSWLNTAITKGFILPVDLSKVNDADWVRYFKFHKYRIPEIVKISPKMKLLIEFDDKLNELNGGWNDVDHTNVINEIIQATKEGKL